MWRDPTDPPESLSLQIAGSWAEHLPSTQWAQEGAERGHPCHAANRRSGLGRRGPATLHPAPGLGRAGWHFYASCVQATPCPRVPHLRLYRWCRVPSPRAWGYPALGFLSPRNGSTNSPLCFWSCWQGGLSAMPAPPLWGHCLLPITSSWDHPSQAWGTPAGCPDAPCPDKGAAPEPAMPWCAMGKA